MCKVSIIIPVYNTEKYIRRCVESCLKQTLEEIEIIMIDDCSKDNSRNIIKEYAKCYPDKVKYIFQEKNQRQGAARNRGMEIACGEYFVFVDSDDWIEQDMCEVLYNKAIETGADMVGSNYYKSWDDRDELKIVEVSPEMYGNMNIEKKEAYTRNYGMFWTRIYKKDFLREHSLIFPENIFYEDAFFNFYSVLYADKIEHLNEALYHYYQENQSTVRNRNNPHQYERIRLAEYILEYGKNHEELAVYKDIIEYKYLNMQGANLIYTCLGQFDSPDKRKMMNISLRIKSNIRLLSQNNAYRELTNEFKFYLRVNSISPAICIYFYRCGIYEKVKIIFRKIKRCN